MVLRWAGLVNIHTLGQARPGKRHRLLCVAAVEEHDGQRVAGRVLVGHGPDIGAVRCADRAADFDRAGTQMTVYRLRHAEERTRGGDAFA